MADFKKKITSDKREYRGRAAALEIINRITLGGGFTNVLVANLQDDASLDAGDRRAAMNLVYGVMRNIFLIDEVLRSKSSTGKLKLSPKVLNVARMAVFEIVFMNNIASYASVSTYISMAKKKGSRPESSFLNACLRKVSSEDVNILTSGIEDPAARMATLYSFPEWIVSDFIDTYGADITGNILRASNNPQPTYFRVNTTRTTVQDVLEKSAYAQTGLENVESPPCCVALPFGKGDYPISDYRGGILTAQDRSTQFISCIVSPEAGQRILDLCSGSGIKTAHIAEIASSRAEITAIDLLGGKLESLAREFSRLGLGELTTIRADATQHINLPPFDTVLVDAPCSGSGTFRRRPDIKLRISKKGLSSLLSLQDRILDNAASLVVGGGSLVYSTCSLLDAENGLQVRSFLDRHPEFRPVSIEDMDLPFDTSLVHSGKPGIVFLPNELNACGAYVCVLRKPA